MKKKDAVNNKDYSVEIFDRIRELLNLPTTISKKNNKFKITISGEKIVIGTVVFKTLRDGVIQISKTTGLFKVVKAVTKEIKKLLKEIKKEVKEKNKKEKQESKKNNPNKKTKKSKKKAVKKEKVAKKKEKKSLAKGKKKVKKAKAEKPEDKQSEGEPMPAVA